MKDLKRFYKMNLTSYLIQSAPAAPQGFSLSDLWKRLDYLVSMIAAQDQSFNSRFFFQQDGNGVFQVLLKKEGVAGEGVELFNALKKFLPEGWVENEKKSWSRVDSLNFKSPVDALVYTAFRDMKLHIIPPDGVSPKKTQILQSPPMAFAGADDLFKMMMDVDCSFCRGSSFERTVVAFASITNLLESPYSPSAEQEVINGLLRLNGHPILDTSFEKKYSHGWITWAIANRRPEWIRPLMRLRCSAFQDYNGVFPLSASLLVGDHSALEILLKHHVSPDTFIPHPPTIDEVLHRVESTHIPALVMAALMEDLDSIKILIKAGADPNKSSETGISALEIAARNGDIKMIYCLVGAGADLGRENQGGAIPAEFVPEGHDDLFEWMEGRRSQQTGLIQSQNVQSLSINDVSPITTKKSTGKSFVKKSVAAGKM